MKKINILLLLFLIPLIIGVVKAIDNETRRIMPFVESKSGIFCTQCHNTTQIGKFKSKADACAIYCKTCHKNMDAHHKTGYVIDNELSGAVNKLTNRKELACYTCHDLTINKFSDKSYKAESLFGGIFSFKSKHKTYYLVVRNNNGQMCKTCH